MSSAGGSTEIVHQGWLTKSPPSKGIFKPRWRRRWFILRAGSFPNQYVLEYFTDQTCRRLKGKINLDECEQLDLSSNLQISAPLFVQEKHKHTFNLRTPHRTYYLAADSEAEMSKWIRCLCQICGLKTAEEEIDICNKPLDENNQPVEIEESPEAENLETDESSPTLSSVPSPYIPISECFSGKPIKFNKETDYCNSSVFSFPPKVNWATYPRKGSSSTVSSVSSVPPIAPPRPPKTIPSNAGPAIDRSRKPPDSPSPITLGPTPVQIKSHPNHSSRSARFNDFSHNGSARSNSTLPSYSSSRRVGPILSPSDRKPIVFHEYERPKELLGAYLQIDTKSLSASGSEGKIHGSLKSPHRKPNGIHSDQDASVEYRLIDPIKTKALNQMIHEREEQLRATPVSKNQS